MKGFAPYLGRKTLAEGRIIILENDLVAVVKTVLLKAWLNSSYEVIVLNEDYKNKSNHEMKRLFLKEMKKKDAIVKKVNHTEIKWYSTITNIYD